MEGSKLLLQVVESQIRLPRRRALKAHSLAKFGCLSRLSQSSMQVNLLRYLFSRLSRRLNVKSCDRRR